MLIIQEHTGAGIVNSLINKLPFELHLPSYQWCGPGTRVKERLARGDTGINPLDSACKEHDLAYSKNKSLQDRHKADAILENQAWDRVKAKNSSFGEKSAAWLITNTMKVKRKLGMGMKKKAKKTLSFNTILRPTAKSLTELLKNKNDLLNGKNGKLLRKSSLHALRAARVAIKKAGGKRKIRIPRSIPFDDKKLGGILPLLPILSALGALGALAGGASTVAKNVIDITNAKNKLTGDKKKTEEIGVKGSGLYLKKTQRGFGLYLKKKNFQ